MARKPGGVVVSDRSRGKATVLELKGPGRVATFEFSGLLDDQAKRELLRRIRVCADPLEAIRVAAAAAGHGLKMAFVRPGKIQCFDVSADQVRKEDAA